MKAVCAFCGFRNRVESAHCAQCGESLAGAERVRFHLPWAAWLPALAGAGFLGLAANKMQSILADNRAELAANVSRIQSEQQKEIRALAAQFGRTEAEEEAKHRSWLRENRVISGALAAERHATEWKRRQNHDPAFASTLLEQTLVEVERLGKDPSLTAEAALKKVAEMVSPPGSRIEVTPSGERFVVRVAFRLSAVTPFEAGTMTLHQSSAEMRRQMEDATVRVIRSLFDYCGSRGIARLSVSCNRALVEGEPGAQQLKMRSLYRVSVDAAKASEVASWRGIASAQVEKLLTVERDATGEVRFLDSGLPTLALDPNEPLEF